jgi:hypothetical protein
MTFQRCPDCGREALPNAIFVSCVNTKCRNFSFDVLTKYEGHMRNQQKTEKNPFEDWETTLPCWPELD